MGRIQQLSPHIVNQIAAGEVIERPASVVKELVENALDAGSTRIEVNVEEGGSQLIRVKDDGHGIEPEDLELAFASHATSKLRDPEDLFHIDSLGFRGEALASIASVSTTTIRTCAHGAPSGYDIECQAGIVGEKKEAAATPGTTIEVRNLFGNVPVRRRFLKSASVELGHITETMTRFALAHPGVGFRLTHGKREVLSLEPAEDLRERIRRLYGADLASEILSVETSGEGFHVSGFIAPPHIDRPRQDRLYVFLNGRYVRDRSLVHAVAEGYRGFLMVRRHPTVFLSIRLDPEEVDVNVHPTKIEVRFRDSRPLYGAILRMVREALFAADMTPSIDPARSGSGSPKRSDAAGAPATDSKAAPAESKREIQTVVQDYLRSSGGFGAAPPSTDATPPSTRPTPAASSPSAPTRSTPGSTGPVDGTSNPSSWKEIETSERPDRDPGVRAHAPSGESEVREAESSAAGTPAPADLPDVGPRPHQLHDTYIVRETEDGFTITDQHALHERILYHQIQDRVRNGRVAVQRLLIPEVIDLSAAETELLLTRREDLARIGFEVERFGDHSVAVQAIPDILGRLSPKDLIQQILMELGEKEGGEKDFIDALIEMSACKAAIKAGDPIDEREMRELLRLGEDLPTSYSCPHGRPTTLQFTLADLEKWFRRRV